MSHSLFIYFVFYCILYVHNSSYSEGCHDDINKVIWLLAAWGKDNEGEIFSNATSTFVDKPNVLANYAASEWANTFGIGTAQEKKRWSKIVLALEQAWVGPLRINAVINSTINATFELTRNMTVAAVRSWRLQQLRYRAIFDALVQIREIHHYNVYSSVMDGLRIARRDKTENASLAIQSALAELSKIQPNQRRIQGVGLSFDMSNILINKYEAGLYAELRMLAGMLFVGPAAMQLSVNSFFAEYTIRAANLDTALLPLSNAPFLQFQLYNIQNNKSMTEAERWMAISALVDWTDPGPGGFYDNLGDVSGVVDAAPHLSYPAGLFDFTINMHVLMNLLFHSCGLFCVGYI